MGSVRLVSRSTQRKNGVKDYRLIGGSVLSGGSTLKIEDSKTESLRDRRKCPVQRDVTTPGHPSSYSVPKGTTLTRVPPFYKQDKVPVT